MKLSRYSAIWLALCAAISGNISLAANSTSERWHTLGNGFLQIKLPVDWRVDKYSMIDFDVYHVFANDRELFLIYLGNAPDIENISKEKAETKFVLNGNPARKFVASVGATNILVMPRCGRDRFASLETVSTASDDSGRILRAMMTLACVKSAAMPQ